MTAVMSELFHFISHRLLVHSFSILVAVEAELSPFFLQVTDCTIDVDAPGACPSKPPNDVKTRVVFPHPLGPMIETKSPS